MRLNSVAYAVTALQLSIDIQEKINVLYPEIEKQTLPSAGPCFRAQRCQPIQPHTHQQRCHNHLFGAEQFWYRSIRLCPAPSHLPPL